MGAGDFKVSPTQVARVARQVLDSILTNSLDHRWEFGGAICTFQHGKSSVITGPLTDNLPTTSDTGPRNAQ